MVRWGIIGIPGVRGNSGFSLACNTEWEFEGERNGDAWRKTLTSLLLDVDSGFGSELPVDAMEGNGSRLLERRTDWDDHGASTVLLKT